MLAVARSGVIAVATRRNDSASRCYFEASRVREGCMAHTFKKNEGEKLVFQLKLYAFFFAFLFLFSFFFTLFFFSFFFPHYPIFSSPPLFLVKWGIYRDKGELRPPYPCPKHAKRQGVQAATLQPLEGRPKDMFLCSFLGIVVGHERDLSCVVVWGHEERERVLKHDVREGGKTLIP